MLKTRIEMQRSATDNSRIPGIICTDRGTLITFFEFRCGEGGDWANISIGMRKSTDDGATWSDRKFLVNSEGNTINNPVMIADGEKIHFLWEKNYNECFWQYSLDEGETWSEAKNITDTFDKFKKEFNWESFAVGPGHGIKTKDGRLVVPVWLSAKRNHGSPISACIYSDDSGESWNCGALMPGNDKIKNPNETCVAELSDGSLLFNHRFESIGVKFEEFKGIAREFAEDEDPRYRCRAFSKSRDGGASCEKIREVFELKDPCCFGAMTAYAEKDKYYLLFSNCKSTTMRRNLTLSYSEDDGKSWNCGAFLEEGSGYSDICISPKSGNAFCFYEEQRTPEELNLVVCKLSVKEALGK